MSKADLHRGERLATEVLARKREDLVEYLQGIGSEMASVYALQLMDGYVDLMARAEKVDRAITRMIWASQFQSARPRDTSSRMR